MHDGTSITSPGRTVTVEVISAGRRLPVYRRGDGYPYVPGAAGDTYLIAVRNLTGTRIEVLASVDGMSLIAEEQASLASSQGLVIGAHGEYRFTGFRTDDDNSRDLVFGEAARSVAEQATGSAANCGVLGIAAWRELHVPPVTYVADVASPPPYSGLEWRGDTRGAGTSKSLTRSAGAGGQSLGTHAGAEKHDPVGRTSFTRAPGEPDILVIGYKELAELTAMGITGRGDPDPFPRDRATGYRAYKP
jgi:hypothetical protein